MDNPLNTQKDYQEYVNQKSPNSPILKNCFNAFWVGGLICSIGQIIMDFCIYKGIIRYNSFYYFNRNKCVFNWFKCF